jgi:sugar phosphate isomerase/epimerase
MKIGLSNLLFVKSSTEDAVRKVAELGAECIEVIFDVPHFMSNYNFNQLNELREQIYSYGLDVSVHASFWDLNPSSHHLEVREFSMKQVKRSIEFCQRLDGKVLVLHPGRVAIPELDWFADGADRLSIEFFDECATFAKRREVVIGIENIGLPSYACSSLEELAAIVGDRDDLGITFDIGHAYRRAKSSGVENPEQSLVDFIKNMGHKIIHVHLHDNHGERDEHLVPGQGSIDFKPIIRALKAINYDGFIVVELFDPGNAFETGRLGLEKTRELLKL